MRVTALWRHPLKAHGREQLDAVTLVAGQSMPYDRTWAVAHAHTKAERGAWARCGNFTRAAGMPQLQAITATLDPHQERLTLRHPARPDLTFHPDTEVQAFLEWVAPLCPEGRAPPADILRLDGRGYTDSPIASVSVMNIASHRAVEAAAKAPLDTARWRGNVWIEGTPTWEEFNWIGRQFRMGAALVKFDAAFARCASTAANPATGQRDIDVLAALDTFGHRDFGVGCTVIEGGVLRPGDTLEPA